MSQAACIATLADTGYPPVRYSADDERRLAEIAAIKARAPYGKDPDGRIINEATARLRVYRRKQELKVFTVRWPLWAGLGLGAAAVGVLLVKSR